MKLINEFKITFNEVEKKNYLLAPTKEETVFGDEFVQFALSKHTTKCDIYIKDVIGTAKSVSVNYNAGGVRSISEALFLYLIITGTSYKK